MDEAEPFSDAAARKTIRNSVSEGNVRFTAHALTELAEDARTQQDALNVLRGGVVSFDSERGGIFRYKCETRRMCVVVAFDTYSEEEEVDADAQEAGSPRRVTIVITAWTTESRT